jgi:hypothetical protein
MSRRISISERAARELAERMAEEWPESWALAELRVRLAMLDKASALKAKANETRRAFGLKPLVARREWRSRDEVAQMFAKAPARKSRKPSKAARREETAAIWDACWIRCGGRCECGCGAVVMRDVLDLNARAELDHVFSRGKGARLPQSVETCWILRADCHRDRHAARPSAESWWEKFIEHCRRYGYTRSIYAASGRLQYVETRSKLGAGLKERPR